MRKIFFIFFEIIFLIYSLSVISASDVSVWQGQYYTGTNFNVGDYNFNFTIYDNLTGGNICYSNTTFLTTGSFGEWKIERDGVNSACDNASKDYFLNINIDGADQTPRRRLVIWNSIRKDVNENSQGDINIEGVLKSQNLHVNFGKLIVTTSGGITDQGFSYFTRYSDDIYAESIVGMKARGTSENPKSTVYGDRLFTVGGRGYGTTGFPSDVLNSTAVILFNAEENFTDTAMGSSISFDITPLGNVAVNRIEMVKIDENGVNVKNKVNASYFIGDGSLLTNLSTGLIPVYLKNNLNVTNANNESIFTIALTPNKINIIHAYLAQSSSVSGVAVQNRVIVNQSGPIGNCHFVTQTAATTEVIDNIALSTNPADTGVTTMALGINIPFINTVSCTVLADANPRNLIIQFNSETIANVTTYAGSYYTNAADS